MTDLATIAEAVDALTNPIRVRERIEYWDEHRNRKHRLHEHTAPSLLEQLHMARVPGLMYVEDDGHRVRSTPRSVPPARIEAINAYLSIEAAAASWLIEFGLSLRDTVGSNIRALTGAHTSSDVANQLLTDLRRWYGQAATLSGWERTPWRPDATCPLCFERGTLRVHLARKSATCVACGESWSDAAGNIGLLGAHIEAQAEQDPPDTASRQAAKVFAAIRIAADRHRLRLLATATQTRPDLPYVAW